MSGAPLKKARGLAARLAAIEDNTWDVPAVKADPRAQDVLPPLAKMSESDVTRRAKKAAMRAKAQEYAEGAMTVLKMALESPDERVRISAANDLLAWGFGKPATEIEAGEGAVQINIIKFGDTDG